MLLTNSSVICLAASGNVRANLIQSFSKFLHRSLPQTAKQPQLHYQLARNHHCNSTEKMSVSQCRQNFHAEVEAGINRQINMEFYASYCYQSMASYFDRDDVGLKGFAKFFQKSSDEEREHAQKFMTYQNKRGGRIVLQDIKRPDRDEWGSGLEAMQVALQLEKNVNQSLLDLHSAGTNHNDAQFCDFLESEYLQEQVDAIKDLGEHITNLKRVGPGLGEYMFDHETLDGEK